MVRLLALAGIAALVLSAGGAAAQVPPEWSLGQNSPDPFCNLEMGGTDILFTLPTAAHVTLDVWDAAMISVVRVLVEGARSAGYHMVRWDGCDSLGVAVPDGSYPYRLLGKDMYSGEVLFADVKVAHVSCATPASPSTWTVIKALYR